MDPNMQIYKFQAHEHNCITQNCITPGQTGYLNVFFSPSSPSAQSLEARMYEGTFVPSVARPLEREAPST